MNKVMTIAEAIAKVPSIGATAPAEIVSEKYSFLPSTRIIEDMNSLGWDLTEVKGIKSGMKNKHRKAHGRHFLIFQNDEIKIKKDEVTEAIPQIIIENNSMGTGRLKIHIGIFRLVCENGLVIAEKNLGEYKMRHLGYSYEDLQELVNNIVADLPMAVAKINTFTAKELTEAEMKQLASEAIKVRLGSDRVATNEEIAELLKPRRTADEGNNLWVVFNRVQESVMRGGGMFLDANGKLRKMKASTNIMVEAKQNKELWALAEQFA
jgi:hypothetical protein